MSKLEFEISHFLVILVLLLLNVGGCGCQPLNSKFILKVKSQMANPSEHIHGPFLTQMTVLVENLGFQSITNQYGRPCTMNFKIINIQLFFFAVIWDFWRMSVFAELVSHSDKIILDFNKDIRCLQIRPGPIIEVLKLMVSKSSSKHKILTKMLLMAIPNFLFNLQSLCFN